MITGEILRTVLIYDQPSSSTPQNVFHHLYTGPGIDDQEIINSVNNWIINGWGDAWQEVASSNVSIEQFQCDVVNPDGTVARNLGGLLSGIAGGLPSPYNSAAASGYLLAYTDEPKQRGSKYAPGIAEAVVDNNLFDPIALANLAALLAVYVAPITVGGLEHLIAGVLSRTLVSFVQFNGSGLIDGQPAYQRRRKQGVGI